MAPNEKQSLTRLWLPVMTLTGWLALLAVGLLGFALPYVRPEPPLPEPELPPIAALDIELTASPPTVRSQVLPPPDAVPPPPLADQLAPLSPPSAVAVIELTDTAEFPVPVEVPAIVDRPAKIAPVESPPSTPTPVPAVAASAVKNDGVPGPVVTSLRFGQGEGRQAAPIYPRQAVKLEQEGAVTVVFTVGAEGRVVSTELSRACPFPLLNNEALRVIKQRWRFAQGEVRRYEVTIRFELTR
jgi:periplasmic protein TonB